MALPASGNTISMSQINTELGRSSSAQISLNLAEAGSYATINTASSSRPNGSTPNAMSEWLSYNHTSCFGYGESCSSNGQCCSDNCYSGTCNYAI